MLSYLTIIIAQFDSVILITLNVLHGWTLLLRYGYLIRILIPTARLGRLKRWLLACLVTPPKYKYNNRPN